jgi:trigger factor
VEGCKHELEISIPVDAVTEETGKATEKVRQKVHLKGFRAGKAPASMVSKMYSSQIRQEVLEALVPKYFEKRVQDEQLKVVGSPNYKDVHFHDAQPLTFKAEFEVYPELDLAEYRGVEIEYKDPDVTDEDVTTRIDEIRDSKAQFVNVDPRPLESGDYAVVALESLSGADEPIRSDEVQVLLGGAETLAGFTENLTGSSPGDEKEFDVTYPEDYGREQLAGKTVRFRVEVKGLRRKELPELNDDFAQDMGDFRTLDEFRAAVRKSIVAQREAEAQRAAKDAIVDKLVDANEFPVPEVFINRQIENRVETRLRSLAEQGMDPNSFKLDWEKIREAQKPQALREVKASLIMTKVAEKESIFATQDEVDQEINRIAAQQKQPVAVMRRKLGEDGSINRIVSHIQTEKTLNFLFEHATKKAS